MTEPEQIGDTLDRFPVKVCGSRKETTVAHLPKFTRYLLDRGATPMATLTSERYTRSSLVQRKSEISCRISVTIPGTTSNLLVLEK